MRWAPAGLLWLTGATRIVRNDPAEAEQPAAIAFMEA